MNHDTMNGPYTLEASIYLTDGTNTAIAKCNLPVGRAPTPAEMKTITDGALTQTQAAAGAEFRLMTRNEFENEVIAERLGPLPTGTRFASAPDFDPLPQD